MHQDIELLYSNPLKTGTECDTRTYKLLSKRVKDKCMEELVSSNPSLNEESLMRAELIVSSPLVRYFQTGQTTTSYKSSHGRKKCT